MEVRVIRLVFVGVAAAAAVAVFAAARRLRRRPSFHGTWDPT
jgi:hypothetical protein